MRSHARAWRTIAALAGLLAAAAVAGGCSGGDDGGGNPPTPPARVWVDPAWTGTEDGSRAYPFNTLAEGLAAAGRGTTLELAAGDYPTGGDVDLPYAVTVHGAGPGLTRVAGRFLAAQTVAAGDTIRVRRLSCIGVAFAPSLTTPVPLVADSCALDSVVIGWPGAHHVTLRASAIAGNVKFAHAGGTATNRVVRCTVGGSVTFSHGIGATADLVDHCTIAAGVLLSAGAGGSATLTANDIPAGGITDRSSGRTTLIAGNHLATGGIDDASGGTGAGTEDEIIQDNVLLDGSIVCRAASGTIRRNTITCTSDTLGILAVSGDPTHIDDNTITIRYAAPQGDWTEWEHCGILTKAGPGSVTGNTISGGICGLMDRSGAADVSGNVISGAHHGLWAAGAGDYVGNIVTGCVGDGIVVHGALHAFAGNEARSNGGAGLRLATPADLGGGTRGCPGGNVFQHNSNYDLVVEVASAVADTVWARHDWWDHITENEVDLIDVYDGKDVAGRAVVHFMPLRTDPPVAAGRGKRGR